jgi:hypothetical protein
MTKHIILWKLRENLTTEEKQKVKAEAKQALEGLLGKIEGLSAVTVNIESLPSSNVDMMLDTTFTTPEALRGYSVHPAHVAAANTYVRPFTAARSCFDYEI